jgi:hypothetical protein
VSLPCLTSRSSTRKEKGITMQVLNPEKASQYMDIVQGERQRSAVLAIHLAWLDHSSPLGRAERIEPKAPLDLLLLYQAAAATFRDWPLPPAQGGAHPPGGRVINRQQATERLLAVVDEDSRRLASLFAGHVIALSSTATSEQDLDYYVELFLKCIGDKRVIGAIASGAISKNSSQVSDPDLW